MPTIFTIEFMRRIDGRNDPAVIERVAAGGEHGQLQTAVNHAANLPRPAGADGFQVRENGGAVLHATWFR